MKVLVADDEMHARRRLARQLDDLGDVTVVGEAATGLEALTEAQRLQPEAMFLDVCMPDLDGLSVARAQVPLPPIVFVTAHDEFAVRAFEVNAVDYLLKPVRIERLRAAVDRLRSRAPAEAASGGARALDAVVQHRLGPAGSPRVVSTSGGVLRFFDARQIARFWSSDKYTLFVAGGAEHLTDEPLAALEQRLRPFGFLRVHRSELINAARVTALDLTDGAPEVRLDDGQRARVSRRLLLGLKAALGL
jgi:DNA-binding LytR/AlgR family response regulator